MANSLQKEVLPNGTHLETKPIEVSIQLRHSPGLVLHLHLSVLQRATMLFISSQSVDGSQGVPAMGSFVYAMPDRYNPVQPICTALYSTTASIDFVTRMARLLARRLKKPCYVGSSISLTTSPAASTVDEEMEAFRSIVDVVLTHSKASGSAP